MTGIDVNIEVCYYGWSKCAAVIGSNRVTWYNINFTTDYPQTHAAVYCPGKM